eukprot:75142_1
MEEEDDMYHFMKHNTESEILSIVSVDSTTKQEIENEMNDINNETKQKELFEKECIEENEYKYELQKLEQFINFKEENEYKLSLFELFEPEMNKLSFKMDKLLLLLSNEYNVSNEYNANDIMNKYNNIYSEIQSNHKLLENNAKNIYKCDSNNKIRMNN